MKKMNKKGFTLIELLAVIVILGLLMAIAIPSVTKYITQSRKKTLTSTIGNYISALTSEVNNFEYKFTGSNTIYAVPIECVALERGGSNPFGTWFPAGANQWAYVLVQYDDKNSSYTYGFTFKDSSGYGLNPTSSSKLNAKGDQILTSVGKTLKDNNDAGLVSGNAAGENGYAAKGNWTGFNVFDGTEMKCGADGESACAPTKVQVLTTVTNGSGDGITTCNVAQED